MRLRNICTYEGDFDKQPLNLKSWFLERGYSREMIDVQIKKVRLDQRSKVWSKQVGLGVPFVITSP